MWAAAVHCCCNAPPSVSALHVHVDKGREVCAEEEGGGHFGALLSHTFNR